MSPTFFKKATDSLFIRLAETDPEVRSALVPVLREAKKWDKLPKGWTQESVKKFWGSLTGEAKHKVTKCIKRMKDKLDGDPGAFCASLADKVDPGWRSRKKASARPPQPRGQGWTAKSDRGIKRWLWHDRDTNIGFSVTETDDASNMINNGYSYLLRVMSPSGDIYRYKSLFKNQNNAFWMASEVFKTQQSGEGNWLLHFSPLNGRRLSSDRMRSGTEKEFNEAVANAKWPTPRRMSTKRTFDAFYSDRGTEVAEKHQILSRGKVQSESYMVNPEYLRGGSMSRHADEREDTEEFESLVGGPNKGFAMMRLWRSSQQAASGNRFTLHGPKVDPVMFFLRAALQERFPEKAIEFYAERILGERLPRNWKTKALKSRFANQVAKTILEQMGGTRRLQMFLGAKDFVALPNGVMFMFPNKQRSRGNKVKVVLEPSDTYRMEFWNVAGGKAKLVKKFDDVYAEDLVEQFESQTGWYLRLASKKADSIDPQGWYAWVDVFDEVFIGPFQSKAAVNPAVNRFLGPNAQDFQVSVMTGREALRLRKRERILTPDHIARKPLRGASMKTAGWWGMDPLGGDTPLDLVVRIKRLDTKKAAIYLSKQLKSPDWSTRYGALGVWSLLLIKGNPAWQDMARSLEDLVTRAASVLLRKPEWDDEEVLDWLADFKRNPEQAAKKVMRVNPSLKFVTKGEDKWYITKAEVYTYGDQVQVMVTVRNDPRDEEKDIEEMVYGDFAVSDARVDVYGGKRDSQQSVLITIDGTEGEQGDVQLEVEDTTGDWDGRNEYQWTTFGGPDRYASRKKAGTTDSRVASRWIAKRGGLPGAGKTFENTKMRWHIYSSGVRVWELLNAGKRGKTVEGFALYDLDYVRDTQILDALKKWVLGLNRQRSYGMALDEARRITLTTPKGGPGTGLSPKIEMFQEKGVDVAPAGFKPIKLDTPNFTLEADFKDFVVRDRTDLNNEPTCIPHFQGGKRDVKVFFRWVSDNQAKLHNMTYSDVLEAMRSEGIKYHSYCAMD